MEASSSKFYGKYRGLVTDNADPLGLARIRAQVPAFAGVSLETWALPCVPYAGDGGDGRPVGLHLIPPPGAHVWIEFEGGDPSFPIWTGCYWGDEQPPGADMPCPDDPSSTKVLQTQASALVLHDGESDPFIKLEIDSPACGQVVSMKFDNDGVSFECGNGSVSVHPDGGITLRVDGAKITMTDTNIELEAETVRINAKEDIVLAAQGDVKVCARGKPVY